MECDLPPEVLGLVIECLPNPADHARFRAVSRSWHSAARQHTRPQLPWILLGDGEIFSPSNGRKHRLPSFPDDAICIGSTDEWLALGLADVYFSDHAYKYRFHNKFLLYNTFSGKSVPLTALDSVGLHEACKIRKFLMRSTPDDFIAVVTDNVNYPLIVFRQGRGAWLPEPYETRYKYIIDVAFLGETLYAITRAEDLIPLDLELDGNGTPMVTMGSRVIKQSPSYDDHNAGRISDDVYNEYEGDEEVDEDSDDKATSTYEEVDDDGCDDEATTLDEDDDCDDDEEEDGDDDDGNDDDGNDVGDEGDEASKEGDISHNLRSSIEYTSDHETGELIITSRHLIESRGKLLLVRQHNQRPITSPLFTRRVDVLEADVNTGKWVPIPNDNGLGGDRALFISTYFSKFVTTPRGEVEADVVYNNSTGEAFDFRSQTSRPSRFCKPSQGRTWLFHPELVL